MKKSKTLAKWSCVIQGHKMHWVKPPGKTGLLLSFQCTVCGKKPS